MKLSRLLETDSPILTEGAVIERLRRDPEVRIDPELTDAPLIYDRAGRDALTEIWSQYIDIGRRAGLPLILAAPTWRCDHDRVARSAWADQPIIADAVRFVTDLRDGAGDYGRRIAVGGLIACRGDAYDPSDALAMDEARRYHRWQARKLAASGVDFIWSATLPAFSEAIGLALALAETGCEFMMGYLVRPTGRMLDGAPLDQAMAAVDAACDEESLPRPVGHMVNCVHPANLAPALDELPPLKRFLGLQGNASRLMPEELDLSTQTQADTPQVWAAEMADLQRQRGLRLVGGCCGTDHRHIGALAELLAK